MRIARLAFPVFALPPGQKRLVLGHESLGRVLETDSSGRLKKGDLVVGIVRRPDSVPCPNCAVGEWDMCRNGEYTERGIKEIDGFMSERWSIEPDYAIKVDSSLGLLGVLLEPTTVVTKAWEAVMAVGQRAFWDCWRLFSESSGAWMFMCLIESLPDLSPSWCALSARPTTAEA